MGMQFKKGDPVQQVVPLIRGRVKALQIVDDQPVYIVAYVAEDGEKHERPFTEAQIMAAAGEVPSLEELQQNDLPPQNEHQTITAGDVGDAKSVLGA